MTTLMIAWIESVDTFKRYDDIIKRMTNGSRLAVSYG
jgi:hypothetical protein